MKKLDKDQSKRKSELADNLRAAREAADKAVEAYGDVLAEIADFAQEVHGAMEDYSGERSEKWQEGDAGQQYQSWIDAWSNWTDKSRDDVAIDYGDTEPDDFESLPESLDEA